MRIGSIVLGVSDLGRAQKIEIDRLLAIGAKEVTWDLCPIDADFVVLEDPDGNKFCVIQKESVWKGFQNS